MIYADIIKEALWNLKPNNFGTRRQLYDQLKIGLKSALEECDQPVDGRDKVIELRLLETTIRRFEVDLRAGVDVTADAYVPDGLEAEQARLYALKVITRAQQSAFGAAATSSKEDASLVVGLSRQMRELSLGAAAKGYRESAFRPATLGALMLRFITEMAMAQGRFGLLLILIEPMLLIGATVVIYLMLDTRFVMNMDMIPFAIMGIVSWMLIRVTAVQVAASSRSNRDLLALPAIRLVSVAVGRAGVQFIIYSMVMVAGLCIVALLGHGDAADNYALYSAYWVLLWVFGLTAGVTIAPLYTMWVAAPRFILIGTRLLSWTSGLVYVSEQFPSELKIYLLWNPILHGVQLMRSAYFTHYKSQDASLSYFLFSVGIMLIMAAASGRLLASRVEPA